MSRSKKLYVLLGIFVVVCLATFGVSQYEEHQEQIKNSDEIILELASEEVTSLSWEYESEVLAFHKDETWLYDEDEAFPVSEEKINELLEQFQEFGASFTIEEVEDYGQYGLDDPLCTITIGTDEETYEIKLGDYSSMDEERYVSIGDGNAYLVENDPLDAFDLELKDMIQNDEIPELDTVTEIQFAGAENDTIVYEEENDRTYSEEDVYFIERDGKYLPLDSSSVNSYVQTIYGLDLSDYVTYHATDEEITQYGLDDPELTVTIQYTTQEEDSEEETAGTFVLNISRALEERKEAEEAAASANEESEDASEENGESEEITAYARIGESNIIYKIDGNDYESVMAASYNDLRHQEVIWADFGEINQIDISLENVDYTITSENKDEEQIWYYQEEELDIADLQTALTALEASDFTTEQPDGKEEISLTIYLDNENVSEVQIELYRYDGSSCLAVVDGEPTALINRSVVVDLIEAVNAIVL